MREFYESQRLLLDGLPLSGHGCDKRILSKFQELIKNQKNETILQRTYKLFISYDARIKLDLNSFRVISRSRTNLLVGRVGYKRITTCVSNRCRKNPFFLGRREMLEEDMLDTPKATRSEYCDLRLSFS